jgi:hypothetical protein
MGGCLTTSTECPASLNEIANEYDYGIASREIHHIYQVRAYIQYTDG